MHSFELNSIKDTTDLLFSLVGESAKIIPLETVADAFIGEGNDTYIIGENSIVIKSKNRLLQFGRDGSFMRILSRKGKGPDEYLSANPMKIHNQVLWFGDSGKNGNFLFGFDLETGKMTRLHISIPERILIHDFSFQNSNQLMLVTDVFESDNIGRIFHCQDLEGNTIFQMNMGDFENFSKSSLTGVIQFIEHPDKCLLPSSSGDTIFELQSGSLNPIWDITIEKKEKHNHFGNLSDKVQIIRYTDRYSIFIKSEQIVKGKALWTLDQYCYFDREEHLAHFFEAIDFQQLGLRIPTKYLNYKMGKNLCFVISAMEFIDMAKESSQDNIKKILAKLKENDNPVLIIAELK